MKYRITNVGCDDETVCDFEFTDKEVCFLKSVFEKLNENSNYGCQPEIVIHPIVRIGDTEEGG